MLPLHSSGNLPSFLSPLVSKYLAAVALAVQIDIKESLDLDSVRTSVVVKGTIIFDSRDPSCAAISMPVSVVG